MPKIESWKHNLFMSTNVLFIRSNCPHCRLWAEFIERINSNLPINKRIKVIDCVNFDKYGIVEHPLIRAYKDVLESYPSLFLQGGQLVEGSNTRLELEAWIKSRLSEEFIFPYDYFIQTNKGEIPLRFEKECKFEGFFKKVRCS